MLKCLDRAQLSPSWTVKHLIFVASKFGDFKRLIYWRSLILAVSEFNAIYSLFSYIQMTGADNKSCDQRTKSY